MDITKIKLKIKEIRSFRSDLRLAGLTDQLIYEESGQKLEELYLILGQHVIKNRV